MLKALTELVDKTFRGGETIADEDPEHALNLATAILLVEVARADYQQEDSESEAIEQLLRSQFDLPDSEIKLLIDEANDEADHAASLQQFTRTLHESMTVEQKHDVIEMLWRVALADSHLDKHEDHLIRRIAGLLYVSHADLIRIRNKVHPGMT